MSTIDILSRLDSDNIEWVDLQFTDLQGILHHVTISRRLVDSSSIERGFGKLDGSSVRGFTGIEESDLVLKPISSTYAVIPWYKNTARLLCQVYSVGGRDRFPRDPRLVAEETEKYLAEQGYRAFVAVEPEFFIFDKVEVRLDSGFQLYRVESREAPWSENSGVFTRFKEGYYPTPPKDKLLGIRLEIMEVLREYFGVEAEITHHEVATAGQAEINFRYSTITGTSDNLQTLKFVVKNIAYKHGLVATFMPKPIIGDNGSGMHTHISLWSTSNGENLFYDDSDEYAEISQLARYFIGGLIEHGRALSAIVSPTVNSYKRLVPGYEAPVYLAWSRANRSAAIRVPIYHRRDHDGKRIEYRAPDPSTNPYLALPAMILAGLDGIKKKLDPGDPIDKNIYALSEEERKKLGIKTLPRTLDEALDELETDNEWLKPVFSREILETYISMKRAEAKKISSYVSPAEAYYYLDV